MVDLRIYPKGPPSDNPFKLDEIRLPFVWFQYCRCRSFIDSNLFWNSGQFYDIHLNNALWSGTELKFEDSKMDMEYLNVRNATGNMKFEGKYPLNVVGVLNIPSLHNSLNIHDIKNDQQRHARYSSGRCCNKDA